MRNHETAMLAYARLARVSHERRQSAGRDRFIILCGREACFAGWLDVATACRDLVLVNNPRHLLAHSASFPDALRDPENTRFFAQLDAFCPFEQAEHLLRENHQTLASTVEVSAGEVALADLEHCSQ
ncbi:hypothetical protein GC176_01775 [bacterium]|nr:hypothetical protein [bacterium]